MCEISLLYRACYIIDYFKTTNLYNSFESYGFGNIKFDLLDTLRITKNYVRKMYHPGAWQHGNPILSKLLDQTTALCANLTIVA